MCLKVVIYDIKSRIFSVACIIGWSDERWLNNGTVPAQQTHTGLQNEGEYGNETEYVGMRIRPY